MASIDFKSHLIVVVSMDLLPVCLHIGHGSAAGKALYKLLNHLKCLKVSHICTWEKNCILNKVVVKFKHLLVQGLVGSEQPNVAFHHCHYHHHFLQSDSYSWGNGVFTFFIVANYATFKGITFVYSLFFLLNS